MLGGTVAFFLFKLGPYLIMSPGKKLKFHDNILESHEINDFKWCSYKFVVPWMLGCKVMLICTDHPLWVYTKLLTHLLREVEDIFCCEIVRES